MSFDELKNRWGWGGFTTHDLERSRLMARCVALAFNLWNLFVRLADSAHHREAIASRPVLLQAIGRQTSHAGRHAVRVALSAAAFGAVVGVGGSCSILAPPHTANVSQGKQPPILEVDRLAVETSELPTVNTASAAKAIAAAVGAPRSSSSRDANQRCLKQTWPYLDGECLSGTSGKDHVRVIPLTVPKTSPSTVQANGAAAEPSKQTKDASKKPQTAQMRKRKQGRNTYASSIARYPPPYGAYREGFHRDGMLWVW